MNEAELLYAIHIVVRIIEVAGIAVMVTGAAAVLYRYAMQTAGIARSTGLGPMRTDLGRSILLGLEFLVAADIINTVAIEPTLESLSVLAGVVLVRTFLSFALEVEIEGSLPWRRARAGGTKASSPDKDRAADDAPSH